MADDTGLDDVGGKIGDGSEDGRRWNRVCDDATRVDTLQAKAREFGGGELKIPPGNAVLRADDGCRFADQWLDLRGELRQTVGFDAEEDHVYWPGFGQIADDARANFEVAFRAVTLMNTLMNDAQAVLLHRSQMRAASEES